MELQLFKLVVDRATLESLVLSGQLAAIEDRSKSAAADLAQLSGDFDTPPDDKPYEGPVDRVPKKAATFFLRQLLDSSQGQSTNSPPSTPPSSPRSSIFTGSGNQSTSLSSHVSSVGLPVGFSGEVIDQGLFGSSRRNQSTSQSTSRASSVGPLPGLLEEAVRGQKPFMLSRHMSGKRS